jgi:integrase
MKQSKEHERPNLGYIERRGASRYLVRWRVNGKQVSQTIDGEYSDALMFLAKKLKNEPEPEPQKPLGRTFGSFLDKEWQHYIEENWKATTAITQGSAIRKHIRPAFESKLFSEITPEKITEFYAGLKKKPLSKNTRHLIHVILTTMFNYAVDQEIIEHSPVKKKSAPKREKFDKPALSEEQLAAVLKAAPIGYRAFYMALALTGCRQGEILGLRWRDLDLAEPNNSVMHIRGQVQRGKDTTTKTEASTRTRPIAPQLRQALLTHRALAHYRDPEDYVFASATGDHPINPDRLRETLKEIVRALGIKFDRPRCDGHHLLRHTSGSLVYARTGGDIKVTQEWLGHSSAKITLDVYTHVQQHQQAKAAEALNRALFQPEAPAITGGQA